MKRIYLLLFIFIFVDWITNAQSFWIPIDSQTNQNLVSVTSNREGIMIAIGENGAIVRSSNYGKEWILDTLLGGYWFRGISFSNSNRCYIPFSKGGTHPSAYLHVSTDAGISWDNEGTLRFGDRTYPMDIVFTDTSVGYYVVQNQIVLHVCVVYGTTDGGITWVLKTQDKILDINGRAHIAALNCRTIISVCDSGWIQKSLDSGATWLPRFRINSIDLNEVAFVDSTHGLAVGDFGTILKTIDGGDRWELVESKTIEELRGVEYFNMDTALIVGCSGTILSTSDGGSTWQAENSGIRVDLNAVAIDPSGSTVVVGNSGVILVKDVAVSVDEGSSPEFSDVKLFSNYPNPFNPNTTIEYYLPERAYASLRLYDLLGMDIMALDEGIRSAGPHKVNLNATNLGSGIYIYRLTSAGVVITRKLLILK